ncbi:MAG: hypothetical protein AAGJ40_06140 [Planctomycetota bacterium]
MKPRNQQRIIIATNQRTNTNGERGILVGSKVWMVGPSVVACQIISGRED